MKRAKIGDIIEIPTPVGLVYAQFTHFHKKWGNLLRVYSQRHTERPRNLCEILRGDLQFTCFIPLQAALKPPPLVEIVGQQRYSIQGCAIGPPGVPGAWKRIK